MTLKLQNVLTRHHNGIRTYGLGTWVQDMLGRYLGLRGVSRSARLKMFPIKAKTLK
jgi:hypothetical protein